MITRKYLPKILKFKGRIFWINFLKKYFLHDKFSDFFVRNFFEKIKTNWNLKMKVKLNFWFNSQKNLNLFNIKNFAKLWFNKIPKNPLIHVQKFILRKLNLKHILGKDDESSCKMYVFRGKIKQYAWFIGWRNLVA